MTTFRARRGLAIVSVVGVALAQWCVVAPAAAAGDVAPPVADPAAVPDAYIVVLDAAASPRVASLVVDSAVRAGGTIGHTYSAALRGFSAMLPAPALAAVRAVDGVVYVEPDVAAGIEPQGARDTGGVQPAPPWNLDRVDQRNLPLNDTYVWHKSGAGVTAYVIDSGIRFTHTEFDGRAVSGPDFYDDDDDSTDCSGHGTHVAGTVGGKTYGVAKDVSLVGIRVLGCDGTGTVSDVLAAFDWVIANAEGRSVINLSMQFGPNQAIDDAIAASFAADILVAAPANAAGDDACAQSPGREPTAVTVAASTTSDARASFSSFGPCIDLFAPGVSILSAGIASDTAAVFFSGTSMSAPHVAGGIAQLLEKRPGAGAPRITRLLLKLASKGKIINAGPDTPNRLLFTRKF